MAHKISSYLKDSLDDNIDFVRSRYCKRTKEEGPVTDRELGTIQYIVCGCIKPFHPDHIRYIPFAQIDQSTDFQVQVIWGKHQGSLQEDIEFCNGMDFTHIKIIQL